MRRLAERAPVAAVAALGAVAYLAVTLVLAARDQLWNDELFTYYFARLPSFGDVWDELDTGVEQTPPLYYALTRALLWTFGNGDVALRLPGLLGVLGAAACVFAIVARRSTPVHGAIGALLLLGSQAAVYSHEGRPYGLVLGLAAAAFLAWQIHAERPGERRALVAMTVALTLAVAMHYYAVLVLVPLGLGEAVRLRERRRLDLPVLAGFGISLLPLVVAAPLIEAARKYSGHFWTDFGWSSAYDLYGWLYRTSAVPAALGTRLVAAGVLAVAAAAVAVLARRALPSHELAAAVGFLLLPLGAVTLAELVTGAFSERYVLATVLGFAVLVPLALHRLAPRRHVAAMGVAVVLAALVGRVYWYQVREVNQDNRDRNALIDSLEQVAAGTDLPIAIAPPQAFFELSHYAPPSLAERLLHLSSTEDALRYVGTDSTEEGLVVLSGFAPLDVRPFDAYVDSGRPFLLLLAPDPSGDDWTTPALEAAGRTLRPYGNAHGLALDEVPAAEGSGS